ncbi:hypothetical protein EIP91_011894 [Steccherinum ochraceum]|uniref:BTB domain-containing protein n=1 Tax=Steccherinum ochraceum TaxID=92696 RepID=A0A4R0RL10_9APHY|nr:hypothetical protein EIP91_011894 [Steccherinum ochraceum]
MEQQGQTVLIFRAYMSRPVSILPQGLAFGAGSPPDAPSSINRVPEDDAVVDALLHVCYPSLNHPFDLFKAWMFAETARKYYEIDVVLLYCKDSILRAAEKESVKAVDLAYCSGFVPEAGPAARACLVYPLEDLILRLQDDSVRLATQAFGDLLLFYLNSQITTLAALQTWSTRKLPTTNEQFFWQNCAHHYSGCRAVSCKGVVAQDWMHSFMEEAAKAYSIRPSGGGYFDTSDTMVAAPLSLEGVRGSVLTAARKRRWRFRHS